VLSVAETGCADYKQTDTGSIFQHLRNGIFIALQSNSIVDDRLLSESSVWLLLAK
jgi:hypothetical protein